jgi:hypothetical protein
MERPLDFFIIGAQKAGSTALVEFLRCHPDVFLPAVKELHYFVREEFYRQGVAYLNPLYPTGGTSLLGGADVDVMCSRLAAARIQEHNPSIRLLGVLRNPVDRAYSAYWFARRLGFEDAPTFEEGLAREAERAGSSEARKAARAGRPPPIGLSILMYVGYGQYAAHLAAYSERFPREQLRIVLHEDLADRPQETLADVFDWLGLPYPQGSIDTNRRVNVAGMPRSMFLQRALRSDDSPPKRWFRRLVPHGLRHMIHQRVRRPLLTKNIRPQRYPPMNDDTRVRLVEYFAPHNARLSALLGRDLSHWR